MIDLKGKIEDKMQARKRKDGAPLFFLLKPQKLSSMKADPTNGETNIKFIYFNLKNMRYFY